MSVRNATADPTGLQEILGYLNFSSGASDPAFLRRLNSLWQSPSAAADMPWRAAHGLLTSRLEHLSQTSSAFRDADQARAVLRLVFDEILPAYRKHHADLLFHQSDAALFTPLFIGRVIEAVLTVGGPWSETGRIVDESLKRLNDFLGYRPVAVLETHKHEPYEHERLRPVPLYIAGVDVGAGRYRDLIEKTLSILRETDKDLLDAAWFNPDLLDELAFDPRAYDFNHPANRRPNYHFGQWDPDLIDNQGSYRRFVIQQATLDAVLARTESSLAIPSDELLFEAAAVLAGTILMASATSGGGPDSHDSSVTLATLLPQIAMQRDRFYQSLLAKVPGAHGQRLQTEAAARQQPFAGARQHLNAELARLRALQMQHVSLAQVFARLGFPEAALRQAEVVPAASARMLCQMQCLLTSGHRTADAGRLSEALDGLAQVEDLLRRAIACGAVIDPWNILAFGGQFSLFPAVENSIPDPRVDDLIDLIEQILALYARLWHEAATAKQAGVLERLPPAFRRIADWWDRYATTSVSGIRHVSAAEAYFAAQEVAAALAAWNEAGTAAGNVAFWRPYAEEFDSPRAYAQVIEVLLDKRDLQAGMALLMHWLGQAEQIGLGEANRSFFALTMRWMRIALDQADGSTGQGGPLVLKLFDYLEANADSFWNVPDWQPGDVPAVQASSAGLAELAGEIEEDGDDDVYGAAYENMVYRDSTADGIDADMLEGGGERTDDELEAQHQALSARLAFLTMLAALWRMVALRRPQGADTQYEAWLQRTSENRLRLEALAGAIQKQPVAVSSASHEALVDYDRRRVLRETLLEKVIATIIATVDAETMLAALVGTRGDASAADTSRRMVGPEIRAVWSALLTGDAETVRRNWVSFLAELAQQPLLYVPLARGGDARKIAAARSLQFSLRELLRRLPRAGLLRETCQLLRVARAMEKNHPQGAGAVTEFDRLFEVGYKAIVESLVDASQSWQHEGSGPRLPPQIARRTAIERAAAADAQLIDGLQQITESLLGEWLSHSRTLRLSSLERVATPKAWQALVHFIERYGHDLFTQQFFHLGNLRGILHQGVDAWLERLAADEEAAEHIRLIAHLDRGLSRADSRKHLALVIEAIVENYAEYRDYNATTTQSDRGELLYSLLDFLRVKVGYERIHWNLRPVIMAHEVLVRRGCAGAAELWRRAMAERTTDAANQQLKRLEQLQTQYGMRLPTITDRLSERFVRPLAIDRVRALLKPAAEEARRGGDAPAFALLEQETSELAQEPCGAGLDSPDWIESLADELERVSTGSRHAESFDDPVESQPVVRLTWDEIQSQLSDWETTLP